jgi:DNA-directed RNA polymerase subunit RPC12/RpoP
MLYEIDTIYCSRCLRYVNIFDAENEEFSTKELICVDCGKILMVVRSSFQSRNDSNFLIKSLEKHINRENVKTGKSLKMREFFSKSSVL